MNQSHEPHTSHDVALVLGGGGAAGNAWQLGVIAGLADAGYDLTALADLVIGTSAGSTAGAAVRSGMSAADLYAAALTAPARPGGAGGASGAGGAGGAGAGAAAPGPAQRPPALPQQELFERLRAIGAAAGSAEELHRALGAFALESDAVLRPGADQRRALVASRLPSQDWPERPLLVLALNAHTGELVAFDRDSGVELADAVTASTALPGGTATHIVDGVHYINGGVRSAENADLAAGYATVIVLSPFGGPDWKRPGQFEGIRRFPGYGLGDQVEALRAQGSRVVVITPDAASLEAMGTNQMDPATRPPSARAGFAQGRREAERLTPAV
ncbi:patatin-like phospholipase family protein [Leifsonia shinshuensis]|uniref:patatin-like phospholipase family protein n=1 Tax=Leifsonia shinshuensis TaxID=150026 RepID=UPI001F50D61D|nr:patatin-like phospholipase family protein [Leifsonia shinshuensis]MCI0158942.1 patatin-like phospholipase family protein [Leifsonia shinshuensis]